MSLNYIVELTLILFPKMAQVILKIILQFLLLSLDLSNIVIVLLSQVMNLFLFLSFYFLLNLRSIFYTLMIKLFLSFLEFFLPLSTLLTIFISLKFQLLLQFLNRFIFFHLSQESKLCKIFFYFFNLKLII